jgi:4-alpha-glucanotransferase
LASLTFAFQDLTQTLQIAYQKLSNDFFYKRHNGFWKSVALRRLAPLINHTGMLICGEDLGMIPESVKEVMNELHILSLELERTPKSIGVEFTDLQTVPYLSVCTTSTHDMEPLRSWWKTNRQTTEKYYNSILGRVGYAPSDCTSEIAGQIIQNHLNAVSMLTIIPLQDWFAMNDKIQLHGDIQSERINIPEDPNHYWCYRMHITLEQLMQADDFNQQIREMIEKSGR